MKHTILPFIAILLCVGCRNNRELIPKQSDTSPSEPIKVQSTITAQGAKAILEELNPSLRFKKWRDFNATPALEVLLASTTHEVANQCKLHVEIAADKTPNDLAEYIRISLISDICNKGREIPQRFPKQYATYILQFLKRAFPEIQPNRIIQTLEAGLLKNEEMVKQMNLYTGSNTVEAIFPPYRFTISLKDNVNPWNRGEWELKVMHEHYDKQLNPHKYK